MNDCAFCKIPDTEIFMENELAKAFYDYYPANIGHMLVIPKRHIKDYFEATQTELTAMNELIFMVKEELECLYHPDGYNIGTNVGESGGQSVFHFHWHIIPRYLGDVENPRGGVRKVKSGIIPNLPEL